MTPARWLPALGALNAIVALAFGTFAAHGIRDPQAREWIMTGVLFQLPHAVAVFALLGWRDNAATRGGIWAIAVGALVFAGVLGALALGAPRGVAILAPIGGTLMTLGWTWLALAAFAGKLLER